VKPFSPSTRGASLAFLLWFSAAACAGGARTADPGGEGGEGEDTGGSTGSGGSTGTGGKAATGGSGPSEGTGGTTPDAATSTEGPPAVTPDAQAGGDTQTVDPGPGPAGSMASAACAGTAVMPAPAGNITIMDRGKSRTFIIRMPASYDGKKPFPILVAFHGAGGGAASFESGFGGTVAKMVADKAIRMFPQAAGGNTWSRDEPDDVLYMDAVVKWLDEKVCYDKGQVFAIGQSSGSYFSHRWACDRGNIVRAVATNSGGQRKERALDCKVGVSSWTSTGLGDNPGHVMGTRQAAEVWRKLAGCSTETEPVMPAPCKAFKGCKPGYAVHHCEHAGGHAPPGYAAGGMAGFLFGGKYLGGTGN
jgi:polyhydroxybutyrate depolymerase